MFSFVLNNIGIFPNYQGVFPIFLSFLGIFPSLGEEMTIGARIKLLQRELGYSSAEKFAEVLGRTTASRLNDIVRGKQKLPDDLMLELITKFNVNANWIIAGVGDMFIGNIPSVHSLINEDNLTQAEVQLNFNLKNRQSIVGSGDTYGW